MIKTERKTVRCLACHRRLRNEETRRIGYGPVCYFKMFGKSTSNGKQRAASGKRPDRLQRLSTWVSDGQLSIFDVIRQEMSKDDSKAI